MARAKRHYLPGYVWHITHRCHKKEFLLKFAADRKRWLYWLFEAKKRYSLCILNYTVTSNHIHLLCLDKTAGSIPKSMQLIAGRTGQEYNQRKERKGAFWEDRYHATAIETHDHLARCIVYMDLNMVRAGVVSHPSQWAFGGYVEIQAPRERYSLINQKVLMELLGFNSTEAMRESHKAWVEAGLTGNNSVRDSKWTESIAVGSKGFVDRVKDELGIRAKGREISETEHSSCLRESRSPYSSNFEGKNDGLSSADARPLDTCP
jgi:REP element-mobilizing transposase RayT